MTRELAIKIIEVFKNTDSSIHREMILGEILAENPDLAEDSERLLLIKCVSAITGYSGHIGYYEQFDNSDLVDIATLSTQETNQ